MTCKDTIDANLLNEMIQNKGIKKNYLAKTLGISNQAFTNKMKGKNLFKVTEIAVIADVIGLSQKDIYNIFFAPIVNKL